MTELYYDVRIHDGDGTDKALERYWATAQEPEEDCKGDTEGGWAGSHAFGAQASTGAEEEFALAVLVEGSVCMIRAKFNVYI